jgi:hypothetical protein
MRLSPDAEVVGLPAPDVGQFGVAQQRLRRDAADVGTDPAPVAVLGDGHGLAELSGADRGDVTSGSGTDDNAVERMLRLGVGAHRNASVGSVRMAAVSASNWEPSWPSSTR